MSGRAERASILVVDDHPENVLALSETLARPDHRIVEARSGAEALRQVLKQDFAVIVMDVVMPHMDGFETARLLRQRDASHHVPIIFLSAAGADVAALYKGYSLGAVDYLLKPVDPEILRAKVDVFVQLHRRERAIRADEEKLRAAERQRSEAALSESETLYGTTFNKVAVGIAHASSDGRWLRVNQQCCDILGYSKEQLLALRMDDVIHPVDAAENRAALRRMIAGDIEEYRGDARYVRSDGSVIWVNTALSVLRDASGQPKHFIAAIEDFTERKLTEERQRFLATASETLLSSLDEAQSLANVARAAVPAVADFCLIDVAAHGDAKRFVAVTCADPERQSAAEQIRLWMLADPSRRAEVIAGRDATLLPEIMQDRALRARFHDAQGVDLLRALALRSWSSVPLVAREHSFGTIVLATCGAQPRRYGPADLALLEDLAHRVAFAVDHARLYRAAQEAVSARDEFLSVASHELRTPLTPLQIRFQWLLSERSTEPLERLRPDRLRSILEQCERQVRRLGALVDNLLDVSRLSAGVLRLNSEPCDLTELARDVIARFSEELVRSQCAIDLSSEPGVVGRWDRLRIEQAMHNLLANAVKYGAGKPIEIEIRCRARRALFRIRDHGIGIDPEKVARIFGRFERAVSARAYGGLGLGLYIVHQIVGAHGGDVQVNSRPGWGSVFTLELPLDVPESGASGESRSGSSSSLGASNAGWS